MSRHSSLPVSAGFTYLGVMLLLAVIGLASMATLTVDRFERRRAAEEELLQVGMEFRNALIAYANATPFGLARSPSSLRDLLRDPRYANARRYLRKIYVDPITGVAQWGVVLNADGTGIVGVHSLSDAQPIKLGNFSDALATLENKTSYQQWIFMAPDPMGLNPVTLPSPDAGVQ